MIDIHTHILPQIDDGSNSLDISIQHLKIMEEAGVTDVVFTPHFYENIYDNNKQTISAAFNLVQAEIDKQNMKMNLHHGAECYIVHDLVTKIKNENFNIDDTKYVLVETSLINQTIEEIVFEEIYKLLKHGLKPILAHPERYQQIIENPESARDIVHRDVYLQVNAGSLFGYYGKDVQKAAWYLVQNGLVHFVASDNHCIKDEYFLKTAKDVITEKIDEYTANLLFEINPRKMLKNEKIEYFYLKEIVKKESIIQKIINRII